MLYHKQVPDDIPGDDDADLLAELANLNKESAPKRPSRASPAGAKPAAAKKRKTLSRKSSFDLADLAGLGLVNDTEIDFNDEDMNGGVIE